MINTLSLPLISLPAHISKSSNPQEMSWLPLRMPTLPTDINNILYCATDLDFGKVEQDHFLFVQFWTYFILFLTFSFPRNPRFLHVEKKTLANEDHEIYVVYNIVHITCTLCYIL